MALAGPALARATKRDAGPAAARARGLPGRHAPDGVDGAGRRRLWRACLRAARALPRRRLVGALPPDLRRRSARAGRPAHPGLSGLDQVTDAVKSRAVAAEGTNVPGSAGRLAWLPIPVLLIAILAARLAGANEPHDLPTLRLVLSFVFYTVVSLGTLLLVGRSFLATGAPGFLLLECGVVLWSLAGTVGDAVYHGDPNINVTV